MEMLQLTSLSPGIPFIEKSISLSAGTLYLHEKECI
jgi:hypothetical protein